MSILRKHANRILRSTVLSATCLCAAQAHAFSALACEGTTLDTGTGILSTPAGGAVVHRTGYRGPPAVSLIVDTGIEQCATNWLLYTRYLKLTRYESTDTADGPARRYPKFFVIQGGIELGWFGGDANPGSGFSWLPAGTTSQWLPTYPTSLMYEENHRLLADPGVPFDTLASFQLRVESPDLGAPYLIDVPAAVVHPQVGYRVNGLWADPAEPGWAVAIEQSLNGIVFALWYTYDESNQPVWFVMSNGRPVARHEVEGDVYFPKGPPLSSGKYDPDAFDPGVPVGKFRIAFSASDRAVLHFDVNGHRGKKNLEPLIVRDAIGSPCTRDTGVYSNRAEPGHGVSLVGGGYPSGCGLHTLFANYDGNGRPTWYFGGLPFGGSVQLSFGIVRYTYTGSAYRPTGPYFAAPYASHRFELGSATGELAATGTTHAGRVEYLNYSIGSMKRGFAVERFTF